MVGAEHRIRRRRRRADRRSGRRAVRRLAGPQRRAVRRRPRPVSGLVDAGQRRQCGRRRATRDRGRGLHRGAGRDADRAGVGHQPRGARCADGDEFLWHQHHPDRAERGRLCAHVGPGGHHDEHLSGRRRIGARRGPDRRARAADPDGRRPNILCDNASRCYTAASGGNRRGHVVAGPVGRVAEDTTPRVSPNRWAS